MSADGGDMDGCDVIQPSLAGYLRGSLSGEDREAVGRHLSACAACRAEWDDFRAIHDLLGRDAGDPAPVGVTERARAAPAAEAGTLRPRWRRYGVPAGIAAAALAGVTGYFLRDAAREPAPVAPVAPPPLRLEPVAARQPLPEPAQAFPALTFRPVTDAFAPGRIAWNGEPAEALALARDARAPVLCMVDNPRCPSCARVRKTVLRDEAVIQATRAFVCLRMDVQKVKGGGPAPLFGILGEDGQIAVLYTGSPLDTASLRAWLEANAPDGTWRVPFREIVRSEEMLAEAFRTFSEGDPAGAARKLGAFDARCPKLCLSSHAEQAETLRGALRTHVASRCAFVRDLVANGELPRAREACRTLAEGYRDSPFAQDVRALEAEIGGLPR